MTLAILGEAESELIDAVLHYKEIETRLGTRFRDEVSTTLAWIIEHPLLPKLHPAGYYRVNLRVFPYYISYVVREETIWVIAVAHGHRKPHYWIGRQKDIS